MLKGDRSHWGSVAKFFHWTIVLLILCQAVVGWTMVNLVVFPPIAIGLCALLIDVVAGRRAAAA